MVSLNVIVPYISVGTMFEFVPRYVIIPVCVHVLGFEVLLSGVLM